jgi:PAS domain-containing protein
VGRATRRRPVHLRRPLVPHRPTGPRPAHSAFAATRAKPGHYQIDFRILHGNGIKWVSARGRGADEGIVGRTMFGVFLDSTDRKEAEEARDLLAGEMGHRVRTCSPSPPA